jgi:Gas vesicle protein
MRSKRPARQARRLRSTVPKGKPPARKPAAAPPRTHHPPAPRGSAPRYRAPRHQVARIVDVSDRSLADVIDSLLNKGVVLNADMILALANVDLIYIHLSALICAADRLARAPGR